MKCKNKCGTYECSREHNHTGLHSQVIKLMGEELTDRHYMTWCRAPVVNITYKSGYKYQLAETYHHKLSFEIPHVSQVYMYRHGSESVKLNNTLVIQKGYAWDGPSGPTFDTKSFMRGSLIHDALYQLMRDGALSIVYRNLADHELYETCLADGMSKFRAWYIYKSVRYFAKRAATAKGKRKDENAP